MILFPLISRYVSFSALTGNVRLSILLLETSIYSRFSRFSISRFLIDCSLQSSFDRLVNNSTPFKLDIAGEHFETSIDVTFAISASDR